LSPRLSILDLTPVRQGGDAAGAIADTLALAKRADALGYHRYWLVEHHNTPGVAGSATTVLIAHLAANTARIRVGAGGVMLPNHAPLVVAEQFGTLEALYPGRMDLGVGRGLNNDAATLQALRRLPGHMEKFPDDVRELLAFLGDAQPGQAVRAVPGQGSHVPVWILGTGLGGAALAAELGLPFAFGSHFAPDHMEMAIAAYRGRFRPSARWKKPHLMLSVTVVAAPTDAEARFHFSSIQQAHDGPLPPPVQNYEATVTPQRLALIGSKLRHALVGAPDRIARGLADFTARYQPDEILAVTQVYDIAARMKSLELLALAAG
jgi:luciferase family oxidoreductase group 1